MRGHIPLGRSTAVPTAIPTRIPATAATGRRLKPANQMQRRKKKINKRKPISFLRRRGGKRQTLLSFPSLFCLSFPQWNLPPPYSTFTLKKEVWWPLHLCTRHLAVLLLMGWASVGGGGEDAEPCFLCFLLSRQKRISKNESMVLLPEHLCWSSLQLSLRCPKPKKSK